MLNTLERNAFFDWLTWRSLEGKSWIRSGVRPHLNCRRNRCLRHRASRAPGRWWWSCTTADRWGRWRFCRRTARGPRLKWSCPCSRWRRCTPGSGRCSGSCHRWTRHQRTSGSRSSLRRSCKSIHDEPIENRIQPTFGIGLLLACHLEIIADKIGKTQDPKSWNACPQKPAVRNLFQKRNYVRQ